MAKVTEHRFTVRGGGAFPLDMLRYNSCWPARGVDVVALHRGMGQPHRATAAREVTLEGVDVPTNDRWESFGWTVISHEIVRRER